MSVDVLSQPAYIHIYIYVYIYSYTRLCECVDEYIGGWVDRQGKAGSAGGRSVRSIAKCGSPRHELLSYLQRGRIKGEQPVYGNATIDAHMSEFSCQIVTDRPCSAVMRFRFFTFSGKFFFHRNFHGSSFQILNALSVFEFLLFLLP